MTNQMPVLMVPRAQNIKSCNSKGDVTRDDLQRPFLAQHSIAMWNNVLTIRNNVATMSQRCVAIKIDVANRLV